MIIESATALPFFVPRVRRGSRYRRAGRVIWLALIGFAVILPAAAEDGWGALELVGRRIEPGTVERFGFMHENTYEATYLNMPVLVARGSKSGPTLCLTAGIHGDEINGVEVARRAIAAADTTRLRGTLVALPAINSEGVRTGNRYLSDRRDLNRAFPGRRGGSVASLIAHEVFSEVLVHCDAVIDLHTASNRRTNLAQIRADLSDPVVRELAIHFGIGIVVGGAGPEGSLRHEATNAGIPAIIYEAGEPLRFQEEEIERGVQGVENVMAYLDMTDQPDREIPEARVYEKSNWMRAGEGSGGFFFPSAQLGDMVEAGDHLARIVDPMTNEEFLVIAPIPGEIIGMAVPQPVLSGYALFHLAWK